jgi:hypothetical protein
MASLAYTYSQNFLELSAVTHNADSLLDEVERLVNIGLSFLVDEDKSSQNESLFKIRDFSKLVTRALVN